MVNFSVVKFHHLIFSLSVQLISNMLLNNARAFPRRTPGFQLKIERGKESMSSDFRLLGNKNNISVSIFFCSLFVEMVWRQHFLVLTLRLSSRSGFQLPYFIVFTVCYGDSTALSWPLMCIFRGV